MGCDGDRRMASFISNALYVHEHRINLNFNVGILCSIFQGYLSCISTPISKQILHRRASYTTQQSNFDGPNNTTNPTMKTLPTLLIAYIQSTSASPPRKYLRQKADASAHTLTFTPTPHYMWSGGLCSKDTDCHPKIRTRVPSSIQTIQTPLCGCYATSIVDPLEECQGEFESGCDVAACFVNSCFGLEAYCSLEKGVCELKSPEIFTIHDAVSWEEEGDASSEEGDGTFLLKHDGHEIVFTLEQETAEPTAPVVEVQPAEQTDTVVMKHAPDETKVIFDTDTSEMSEEEISENEFSMSMTLEQHNLTFQWDDSDTKIDLQHEVETTVPKDGHTDFSWVTLEEDDDSNDDAILEISMSMFDERSVDYTWIESEEGDDDDDEGDDAAVIIATIPTEKATTSISVPDESDTDFNWVDLK